MNDSTQVSMTRVIISHVSCIHYHQDAKYPGTKKPLGFSVLGIIVNPRGGGEAVKYDRSFGRNLRCA